jgi:hypothetical protein
MILKTSNHNPVKKTISKHPTTHSSTQSFNFLIILFLSFLYLSSSFAQVKISEQVEIKPSTSIRITKGSVITTSENYSLRATHYWTQFYTGENDDIPIFRMRFKITSSCSDIIYSDFDYSGNLEFNLTELKGTSYSISLLLSERTAWDSVYKYESLHGAPFQVYVDGEFVKDANNSTTVSPWFGFLGVQVIGTEMIFDNSGKRIDFSTNQACSPIIGRLYEDWPIISITEGSQYLSFFAWETGDTLGDSFYGGDYSNSNIPLLIYDKPLYNNSDLDAIIMAEVNGVTAFDTVKVIKVGDFELDVQLLPVEIAPSEESDILLQQVTYTGLQDFPEEQLFDVEIIEGSEYGTIIASNRVDKSDSFTQIEQGFKFIAEDDIDLDSVEVLIKVATKIEEGAALSTLENRNLTSVHEDSVEPNSNTQSKVDINPKNMGNQNNTTFIIIPPEEEREIFGVGSLKILNKDSIDHFQVTIIPDTLSSKDTLAFTEMARIIVQAKDADSNNIDLDSTKVLKFAITTNTDYGTFINYNGDTLKTSPVVLENISYADAKAGKIIFAAVKENPDSVIKCNIKVALQEDTTINGKREAVVLEQTLQIVMTGDRVVRPNVNRGIINLADETLQTLHDFRKSFSISMTRGGEHVGGHQFRIFSDYVVGSGGHDHSTTSNVRRPSTTNNIKYWNYGHFRKSNTPAILANPLTDTTRENYLVEEYNFLSSRWGDIMKIVLISEENILLKDSLMLEERVSNLVLLPDNTNYDKVGGRCEHHGPTDVDRLCENYLTPDHNHWGTNTTVVGIQNIAARWLQDNSNLRLDINDISLPFGGRFDVFGSWAGSHFSHREGDNVDIRSSTITTSNQPNYYIDNNHNGVYDDGDTYIENDGNSVNENYRFIDDLVQEFKEICQYYNADTVLEYPNNKGGDEHFHLNF